MPDITNQKDFRTLFWLAHQDVPTVKRRKINGRYDTDTRCAFVDYVDACQRDGTISEALANRVTLD